MVLSCGERTAAENKKRFPKVEYIEHIEYIESIENIDTLDTLNIELQL